jgi:hypothetical protein
MATRGTDLSYRISEQNADTNRRRLTRQTNPQEIRAQENERNAQAMVTRRLIQHTGYQSKLLILIKEDWQESNRFFYEMPTKFDTSNRTYLYNQPYVGYGMKNVVMGVGTFICRVQQVPQKRNVVQMVLCLLLVTTLMKD